MSVTPIIGTNVTVPVGGTPVQAIPPDPAGGVITNPYDAIEPLFVNPLGDADTSAGGATFALQPGQEWNVIPGQTTQTTVNAATAGHAFSAIYWL